MFEWLKTILGENYTQEVDKKIAAEIGKSFVAKADYNAKNEAYKGLEGQLAERDTQLEALKKIDAAGLQEELARLQGENKAAKEGFEAQVEALRFEHALESSLVAAKVRNPRAAKAMLEGDLEEGKTLRDIGLEGLSTKLEGMKKTEGWLFEGTPQLAGVSPAEAGGAPATKKPQEMTYEELCDYTAANPSAKLE